MSHIYEAVVIRSRNPEVIIYSDDDREKVIDHLRKYYADHGYSVIINGNRYTVYDLVLREKELTGKVICSISYRFLFDIHGKRKRKMTGLLKKFVGKPIRDDDTIIIFRNGEEVPWLNGSWMTDQILGFMDNKGTLTQISENKFRFDLE